MTAKKDQGTNRERSPVSDRSRQRDQSAAPIPPGDDLERLTALRARLEAVLADPATSARDLASVSREYRMVLAQLAEATPASGSALDEIAARRIRRRGVS